MNPHDSATGMNRTGGTEPSTGWFQRAKGLETDEALVLHVEFRLVMNRYLAPFQGATQEIFKFHALVHDRT
jgi:hypothetical protein